MFRCEDCGIDVSGSMDVCPYCGGVLVPEDEEE